MIGVDWGTTRFRAWRLGPDGSVRDRRNGDRGIMSVNDGRFADVLRDSIGPWLAAGEDRVLLCGMVGSRQGWHEVPYVECPAGAADLAQRLTEVPFRWARARLVPGLSGRDMNGVPEVMRGEETQIVGILPAIDGEGLVCLPGTHAKWARVAGGQVIGFSTHMTGEVFAALRGHTILGRLMRDGGHDQEAFSRGLARSADAGGLLHHLFGIRALGLAGLLRDASAPSYLSGLLIGHEVRAAMSCPSDVHLVGAAELVALYAEAITARGGRPITHPPDAAATGLATIGAAATW